MRNRKKNTNRARATRSTTPNVIEQLEKRQLMAVISVTDFGARPNDGVDDTGAIRAAINASRAGDTVSFAGGTYNVNDKIRFLSHRTYNGGGTIQRPSGQDFIADTDGENTNIKINNLTFRGGGIHAGNAMAKGMEITNTTFRDITRGWPTGNAILVSAGAEYSKFNNNQFINIMGETGIYGFNRFHHVEMNNNHFDTVMEGIHLYYNNGGDNLTVKNNTFIRMRRMAVELQGKDARNTLVEGNKASEWINNYHESFFLSIVNLGYNTVIRNNHGASGKFGQIDPKANITPVGIEISGWGVLVENNVVEGFREGSHIMNIRDLVMRNNKFVNQTWMGTWRTGVNTAGFNGSNLRIENNEYWTANTAFLFHGYSSGFVGNNKIYLYGSGKEYTEGSAGAMSNISKGANQIVRMSGSPTGYTGPSPIGGGTTNPNPEPLPTPPASPTSLVVTKKGATQIDLVWNDNAGDEQGFKIQRRDNSTTTWVDVATVGANVKAHSDTTAKPGTHYSYRVLAYNTIGSSAWSNEHDARTDPVVTNPPGNENPNPTPDPRPIPVPVGTGTGLKGEYFDNRDFTAPKLTRTDATVNFDWQRGSPAAGIGGDTFSVRWTGQIEAVYSEEYTFHTTSDDGVRLWINGQLIIDSWTDKAATELTGKITLQAGKKYDVKLEYYENQNEAVVYLGWSSRSQAKQIVPKDRLYAPATATDGNGNGNGLSGEYFDNSNFTGSKVVRTDATVNYDWKAAAPHAQIGGDTFSVRWTGQIMPRYSEEYTFFTTSDDGVRLWVNGQLLVDQWNIQATTTHSGKITLEAGKKYDIKMEYYEQAGVATAMLGWSSRSQEYEIVPKSQLFTNPNVTRPSGVDLAKGKTVVASSVQDQTQNWTGHLNDGSETTRWASKLGSDNEWVYVDLGQSYDISRVRLSWETAFAKTYAVQVSNDGKTWTTLYSTNAGDGRVDDLSGLNGNGRFVRMHATQRGFPAGFSLWSMEVYGN